MSLRKITSLTAFVSLMFSHLLLEMPVGFDIRDATL